MTAYGMPTRPTLLRSTPNRISHTESLAMAVRYEFGANRLRRSDLARMLGKCRERIDHLWHGRRAFHYDEVVIVARATNLTAAELIATAERFYAERNDAAPEVPC